MFENHAALAIALSLLTEKDKTDKSVFFGALLPLYSEIEQALASGDPVTFFTPPPMEIDDSIIKDV